MQRELGDKRGIAQNLEGLAGLAAARREGERATRLFGAAERVREAMGTPVPPADRPDHDRSVTAIRTALGEKAFAAAWAEGRAMALEDAVKYALDQSDADPPRA